MQLVFTIVYLIFPIAVLVLLWLIYKSTTHYIHIASQVALKSAETAAKLAEMLEHERHA